MPAGDAIDKSAPTECLRLPSEVKNGGFEFERKAKISAKYHWEEIITPIDR